MRPSDLFMASANHSIPIFSCKLRNVQFANSFVRFIKRRNKFKIADVPKIDVRLAEGMQAKFITIICQRTGTAAESKKRFHTCEQRTSRRQTKIADLIMRTSFNFCLLGYIIRGNEMDRVQSPMTWENRNSKPSMKYERVSWQRAPGIRAESSAMHTHTTQNYTRHDCALYLYIAVLSNYVCVWVCACGLGDWHILCVSFDIVLFFLFFLFFWRNR